MTYKCNECGNTYNHMQAAQVGFRCSACRNNLSEGKKIEPTVNHRGNGGATSYYELPKGATELKHLIKHKKMEHGIGEAFAALYRLNDNGEYKRNLTKVIYYIQSELDWIENEG